MEATNYWQSEVELPEKYSAYSEEMVYMLSEFEVMWDVHLERIKTVNDIIELTSD